MAAVVFEELIPFLERGAKLLKNRGEEEIFCTSSFDYRKWNDSQEEMRKKDFQLTFVGDLLLHKQIHPSTPSTIAVPAFILFSKLLCLGRYSFFAAILDVYEVRSRLNLCVSNRKIETI